MNFSKKIITLVLILLTISIYAQQSINYKALIKDGSGNVVANDLIAVQFIIYKGAALINNVYQETHTPTTDANGIIIINIGEGSIDNGVYADIDWASDEHFLNVQINTGSGLVDLGITQFMAVPYALQAETATIANNVTGLEAIDEGNGIGWRLKGQDPANYDSIGLKAVDLSYSSVSSTKGATGNYSTAMGVGSEASGMTSTAMGHGTIASGEFSTAMGRFTTASGNYSTAMGDGTTASGLFSTAMGDQTTASGSRSTAMGFGTTASEVWSTAMGYQTTASGLFSTAMGRFTSALGDGSTAMGNGTTASSSLSTAIGRYNIGGGHPIAWVATDKLFEIGNGSSNTSKQNAFTVLKNGKVGISTPTPTVQLQITGGVDASMSDGSGFLVIGDENTSNIVIDQNEIIARSNGNNAILHLQTNGGAVWVGGSQVHSSDRRLKKDIVNLPYGLQEILQLQPKAYNWKNREQTHKSFGLIAQDVQSIIEEIVHVDDDEIKTMSLSYTELIPVLIKAIQEQQEIIMNSDYRIQNYENEVNGLKNRLAKIEALLTNNNTKIKPVVHLNNVDF